MTVRQLASLIIGYIGVVMMAPGAAVFWLSCWIGETA
jgi:hypothetical protein